MSFELSIALMILSNFLLSLLLCFLYFSKWYDDSDAADTDETNGAQPESDDAEFKSNKSFLIKIVYKNTGTVRRLLVPIVNGYFEFDMNELKDKITELFGLPRYSELELRYIDEDGWMVTMTNDKDLEDIMTQSKKLKLLRLYVNHATTTTYGDDDELELLIPTSPTNDSVTLSHSKSDNDDWLITNYY